VDTTLAAFDLVRSIASAVFLGAGAVAAVVCAGDWLVRTRRLSPFGAVARFFRSAVDPAIAPVERAVVRFGGVPTSAPWWALLGIVILGIGLLSLLDALRTGILSLLGAAAAGPKAIAVLAIAWTCGLLQLALIVRVIASFVRISEYSRWVRWSYTLTDWLVRPIRKRLPPFGMFDLSPLAAYFLLMIIQWLAERAITIS
jgi:YggT family protein